jgi:hypothetical protein
MMAIIYEAIGRLVVEFVKRRYRREIRAAAAVGVGVTVLAIGAYLANRETEEQV